jgi:hypothetical protein
MSATAVPIGDKARPCRQELPMFDLLSNIALLVVGFSVTAAGILVVFYG